MMRLSHDPFHWAPQAWETLLLAISAGTAITVWLRKRSARYWPISQGRVEYASSFENSGTWLTDVSYSYRVADEFYSGQFRLTSRSQRKASEIEARWKNNPIDVRYSPKKPEISIVRTEDQARISSGEFLGH
jgi:Protein of unknown function (DUF3592)